MILVAEDQGITALELKLLLKQKGYDEVLCFCSGKNAIECIFKETPDFAILDIRLADDVSGLDIAKALKLKNIPFIFVSAFSDPEYYKNAEALNPAGMITKPFDASALLAAVDKIQNSLSV